MILGREPLFIFPDKMFSYTFSQMVSLSSFRPDTLRYCEQAGFIKIKRNDKGYRYFDDMQKILELLKSKSLILDGDNIGNIICSKKESDSLCWYYQLNLPFSGLMWKKTVWR